VLLVLQGVVDRHHAAPRVPVEHEILKTQAAADFLYFLDVAGQRPQGRVVRLIRVIASELIVVVHLDAGLRQK
jgi:hypothetical protein